MLFLLHGVNDCFEGFRLVDGKVGEDFAIKVDTFFLHAGDELRIGKTELAGSIVDAGNPEGTEIALFVAAVAVGVLASAHDRLLGDTEHITAAATVTLGGGNDFLVTCAGGNAAFDARHSRSPLYQAKGIMAFTEATLVS